MRVSPTKEQIKYIGSLGVPVDIVSQPCTPEFDDEAPTTTIPIDSSITFGRIATRWWLAMIPAVVTGGIIVASIILR